MGELVLHDFSTAEEIPVRAAGAAILVTNKSPIRAELIAGSPELRFITVTAPGFDCVDLAAARRRGIPVSNVPEYGTLSVAQYVFALLLELCHHVAPAWGCGPGRGLDATAGLFPAQDAAV